MPGYPEGYRPQPPYSLSQEKFGDDVSGEVQYHTGLAEYVTQYNTQMYSAGTYEQNGVGGSSKSCPAQCGRHGSRLWPEPAVTDFPETDEWEWRPQVPAAEGVRTAGMPAALSVMSKSRATLIGISPHQAYGRPNVARVDPRIPIHSLGCPIQQVECEQCMGSAPILGPQPAGAADAESWVSNDDQSIVGMQRDYWWSGVPFDGPGTFRLEISEGSSSGEAGAYMDERYVVCVDEGGLSPSSAGEYGVQAQFFPGYTHGAQSSHPPYDPQTREYIERDGEGGEFDYYDSRRQCLTIWS